MQKIWLHFIEKIVDDVQEAGLFPHQMLVLLPFAQHIPIARRIWRERIKQLQTEDTSRWGASIHLQACAAMVPRWSTTQLWSLELAPVALSATDLDQGVARDSLNALLRIQRAQKEDRYALLSPLDTHSLAEQLLERASALAEIVKAIAPDNRQAWLQRQLSMRSDAASSLEWHWVEEALNTLAYEWAASSRYRTDNLWHAAGHDEVLPKRIWVLQSLQHDALTQALAHQYSVRVRHFDWQVLPNNETSKLDPSHSSATLGLSSTLRVIACEDMEREAQQGAAAVLDCIQRGLTPLALVVQDRLVSRRIAAILRGKGLREADVYDETGWTLSTTQVASGVMALLRATSPQASSDEWMQWLKQSPRWMGQDLDRLEQRMRLFAQEPEAGQYAGLSSASGMLLWLRRFSGQVDWLSAWDSILSSVGGRKSLTEWLSWLQDALTQSGQWAVLQADAAGRDCIRALHFQYRDRLPALSLSQREFTQWVATVLEAERFRLAQSRTGQDGPLVRFMPLGQLVLRDFAAVVMPGCDAQSLPWVSKTQVWWSAEQRAQIGLPSLESLAQTLYGQWQHLLCFPEVTLLYRNHVGEEPVGPSPLLADCLWRLRQTTRPDGQTPFAKMAMQQRRLQMQRQPEPHPTLKSPSIDSMTPSQYQSLRNCPYQFYARNILRLREHKEWQTKSVQQQWGLWLHDSLERFHQLRKPQDPRELQAQLLDRVSRQVQEERGLAERDFLAYRASWPRLRDAYLDWLAGHEAQGWTFTYAEKTLERRYGEVLLRGKIDRLDTLADQDAQSHPRGAMLIDYKTESLDKTIARVSKHADEEIQLAFYYALYVPVFHPSELTKDTPATIVQQGGETRSLMDSDTDDAQLAGSIYGAYLNLSVSGHLATQAAGTSAVNLKDYKNLKQQAQRVVAGVLEDTHRINNGHPLAALGHGQTCSYCEMRGLCRRDFWQTKL